MTTPDPDPNPDEPTIETRLTKLEADSHPPMPYVTCTACWALVAEDHWTGHLTWHRRASLSHFLGGGG